MSKPRGPRPVRWNAARGEASSATRVHALTNAPDGVSSPLQLEVGHTMLGDEELVVFRFPAPRPELWKTLTAAERVVATGLLRGDSYAQIAQARGSALRTVANQVRSIFQKLGLCSRNELAAHFTLMNPRG